MSETTITPEAVASVTEKPLITLKDVSADASAGGCCGGTGCC